MDKDEFFRAYVICALWSSIGDNGEPLDNRFTAEDISAETYAEMRADCADFLMWTKQLLGEWSATEAGHDFWLTRNGHGTGFWDRGKANGDALTELSEIYGQYDLYIGDDGLIYS